eukprot:g31215.t1
MGLASLPGNTPSSWTVPYQLSFVEKFDKIITSDRKSIRKWSAHNVLKNLREKEKVDPATWFPKQTVQVTRQNASSPEHSNRHQDITWLVNKELTLTECCRLARSKVRDYVLWDALKLGAAVVMAHWERPLFGVVVLKLNGG